MNIYFCKSGNYFSWVAASSSVAAKRRFVASYEPCTDVTCFVARQNVKCPAGPVDLGNIQRLGLVSLVGKNTAYLTKLSAQQLAYNLLYHVSSYLESSHYKIDDVTKSDIFATILRILQKSEQKS